MKIFLYCFRDFDEKEFFDDEMQKHDFTYSYTSAYPSLENAHLAEGYDAVSVTPTRLDEALLEKFHSLGVRYVLTRSIGYDHIDLATAKRLGMGVSCVSYPPETVASYAFTLMMMCLRMIKPTLERAAVQDYSLNGKIGRDLSECSVGIIGTGRIGGELARNLQSFGTKVYAYDTVQNPDVQALCQYLPLDRLTEECDVISLHMPVTDKTFHMVDGGFISRMKKGSYIINTARGALIDTDALIAALESGHLAGAALDVLEDESGLYYYNRTGDCISNRQMAVLRSFPNVILTPHTAFYTRKVVRSMAHHTVNRLFDMREGRGDPHIISYPQDMI